MASSLRPRSSTPGNADDDLAPADSKCLYPTPLAPFCIFQEFWAVTRHPPIGQQGKSVKSHECSGTMRVPLSQTHPGTAGVWKESDDGHPTRYIRMSGMWRSHFTPDRIRLAMPELWFTLPGRSRAGRDPIGSRFVGRAGSDQPTIGQCLLPGTVGWQRRLVGRS